MSASKPVEDLPNIVLTMSDDHDPNATSCNHEPVVDAPNLNRLAREGVVFDACYTMSFALYARLVQLHCR